MRTPSALMRLIRGSAALLVLAAGVIGVPVFLVVVIGNPLPESIDGAGLVGALSRPDDGSILVGLVVIAAWLSWLVFTVSVAAELVTVVSRHRIRIALPGLARPQHLASALVAAVIALAVVAPQVSQATAVRPMPTRTVPQTAPEHGNHHANQRPETDAAELGSPARDDRSVATPRTPRGSTYVVQRGDDLWTLAERFYGEGQRWRQIAAANPAVLTGGPDRLQPGWELIIPGAPRDEGTPRRSHLVLQGDTLSSVAAATLGDDARWPDIFELNQFQLDDPDELPVGIRLVLPAAPRSSLSAAGVEQVDGPPSSSTQADDPTTSPSTAPPASTARPSSAEPDALPKPDPEPGSAAPAEPPAAPAPSAAPSSTTQPSTAQTSTGRQTDSIPSAEPTLLELATDPVAAGVAGAGGLLAAAVVAGAGRRRRAQLQARPLGRRIPQPAPAARLVESHLGRRQRPLGLRTLDLATRAIAAHCHRTGAVLPELVTATVAEDRLVLEMSEPDLTGPAGFTIDGRTWRLDADGVDRLRSTPGLSDAVRPYPALVSLGTTADDAQIVVDLESLRLTSVEADRVELADAALAAMAIELACSPWAEELELILVGTCRGLPSALGEHGVTHLDDLKPTLDRLARRATAQRRQLGEGSVATRRVDPDLADPWVPTILIVNRELTAGERQQLDRLVMDDPPVSIAAVALDLPDAGCRIRLAGSTAQPTARIAPNELDLTPQLLTRPATEAVIGLVETTGRSDTTPAPWWFDDEESTEPDPPDNVTYLGRRFGGWTTSTTDHDDHDREGAVMEQLSTATVSHPMLRLLGPVELEGPAGVAPTRAAKQCLEYCAWLLEHPGTTAQAMAAALAVAEGTRRSNMSRLRAWLGSDELDQPYLPDAYSGRILLHPSVSSDWQRLQIITSRGVNRTSTSGLEAALRLVRGAPLADAAPGQWHWAEGLRTDMISVIRDLGVELAERALGDSDIGLARWAAARALLVAPGDELLLVARIKTEHRAGNQPEVERLTLQLAAHARTLEVDLQPETVDLLQEMMEGGVRARLA